jgi:hypothetical protein
MEYSAVKKLRKDLVEYERPMYSPIKADKKHHSGIIDNETVILLHKQRKRIDSH